MTTASGIKGRRQFNWTPYILILPSLVYLALFFAWPMVQGLILAVREDGALLTLRSEAETASAVAGQLPRGMQVDILDQQANPIPAGQEGQGNLLTEVWFQVRGETTEGEVVEGWTPERRIRVRESASDGSPIAGTVRSILSSSADPLTSIHAEASEGSEVLGKMDARTAVEILDQTTLEVWYRIKGERGSESIEGWVPARYINPLGDDTRGRIEAGDTSQFTTRYIERMVNDRFFWPALRTTLL